MRKESPEQRASRIKLVEAYQESGQSYAEFSRERGITSWQIRKAVRDSTAQAETGKAFEELSVSNVSGLDEYRIILRNGRELSLPAHFSEKRVRHLIEILESC